MDDGLAFIERSFYLIVVSAFRGENIIRNKMNNFI